MSIISKPIKYFKESKEELKKVSWPTGKEALHLTIVVVVISGIIALFLGFFDLILNEGMSFILKK